MSGAAPSPLVVRMIPKPDCGFVEQSDMVHICRALGELRRKKPYELTIRR
jgi:hypothetical protein